MKKYCDCITAAAAVGARNTYECSTDSDCQCNAGFYGNGRTCTPCKRCSPFASSTQDPAVSASSVGCPMPGALLDGTPCSCNNGYYGDGVTCTPCKTCSPHAATYGACTGGEPVDLVQCCCVAGFFGNGIACSPCPAGTYSASTCACATRSRRPARDNSCGARHRQAALRQRASLKRSLCRAANEPDRRMKRTLISACMPASAFSYA